MEAKKTLYNNTLFRSKLEAKWAVFFDLSGIKYQYEPEAFLCEDKSQYTPDFFLPEAALRNGYDYNDNDKLTKIDPGVYLEIKPLSYNWDELYEKRIFSAINPNPLILFVGDPIDGAINSFDSCENHNHQLSPWWDNCMTLMKCCKCHKVKFEFNEGNYYICNECGTDIISTLLMDNAMKARNFRFQFYSSVNN